MQEAKVSGFAKGDEENRQDDRAKEGGKGDTSCGDAGSSKGGSSDFAGGQRL